MAVAVELQDITRAYGDEDLPQDRAYFWQVGRAGELFILSGPRMVTGRLKIEYVYGPAAWIGVTGDVADQAAMGV